MRQFRRFHNPRQAPKFAAACFLAAAVLLIRLYVYLNSNSNFKRLLSSSGTVNIRPAGWKLGQPIVLHGRNANQLPLESVQSGPIR
jgi:hypothetical protein